MSMGGKQGLLVSDNHILAAGQLIVVMCLQNTRERDGS